MKFMHIHTFYPDYLNSFYIKNPQTGQTNYNSQIDAILKDGFAGSHMFVPYLKNLGYDPMLVIANCRQTQVRWLLENAPNMASSTNLDICEVALKQVETFKPDVLYLGDPITFDSRFIRALSYRPALVFGWRAAGVARDTDWSEFDIILSNFEFGFENARKHGARSTQFFMPGFPLHLAEQIAQEQKKYDVVFSGQVTGDHLRRQKVLEDLCLAASENHYKPALFIPGHPQSQGPILQAHNHGPVWGLDMHRTLKQGRIVLNVEIDMARDQSGNMRLFECTGSGSFFLTDLNKNISRYFEPGKEIETFSSQGELMEKIRYYLDHPAEREEIALRGQQRCLSQYSMENQAKEFDCIIKSFLASTPAPRPETAADLTRRAMSLVQKNHMLEAFNLLNKAKALKTPVMGLDRSRADLFLHMGDKPSAIEALREELRFFPGNLSARQMLESLLQQSSAPGSSAPDYEPEFVEILQVIRPYTMLCEERLYSLYMLARAACEMNIPGNFVECGVAAGGSSALLAWVIKKYSRQPRHLFCFDSFSGMPQPSEYDTRQGVPAESTGWGAGTCAASEQNLEEVCTKLGVLNLVTAVKGYFEDTLPQYRNWTGMISLLHMNGRWYSSTKNIINNLYDHLSDGAIMQVDDYGQWDGCRKAIHEFEKSRRLQFNLKGIDATGVWFTKPDTFPKNPKIDTELVNDFSQDNRRLKEVISQMSENERFQLYYVLRSFFPPSHKILRFIEIGSYSGASLMLACMALLRQCIPFQGFCVEPGGTPQLPQVLKLLQSHVIHLPMLSHDAAGRFSEMFSDDDRPQFIFVDGDHTYEGVRKDILNYYPLLAPGGIMMFHDYLPELNDVNRPYILKHHGGKEPGIRRACHELMENVYGCEIIELPLLYPTNPTQTQPHISIIPEVYSTVRAYRKPLKG